MTPAPGTAHFRPADLVSDGALVAVGGVGTSRKPMALVRELAASGVRGLRLVSVLGSVDVEYLLAAGCIAELHTAGVAIDGIGMAPLYRRARQAGDVRVVQWSEGCLHAALEAAGRGLPSLACATSPESHVVAHNDNLTVSPDPFTGRPVVHARALAPDLTLLHVAEANGQADLFVDGDVGFDVALAWASRQVVASADRISTRRPGEATLSRIWVDALVHRAGGAWPTGCYPSSAPDQTALQDWVDSPGDLSVLARPSR